MLVLVWVKVMDFLGCELGLVAKLACLRVLVGEVEEYIVATRRPGPSALSLAASAVPGPPTARGSRLGNV